MKKYEDLEELCRDSRRDEDPSREDYEAVARGLKVRLGIAAAIGTTASVAKAGATLGGAATKASLATLIVGWGVGGAVLGGVTALVLETTFAPPVSSAVTPRVAERTGGPQRSSPERVREIAPRPVPAPAGDARGETSAPPELRDRRAPSSLPVKPAPKQETALTADARVVSAPEAAPMRLEEEARALTDVQRALRDTENERALALLDRMDTRFGEGALGTERRAARVLALCALGRYEEGHILAEHFIAHHPTSPLVGRIRAACR